MKRLYCLALCIVMMLTYGCSFAENTDDADHTPSDLFVEKYTNFFEGAEGYRVVDEYRHDISDTFYNEYLKAYQKGDFQTIWDAVFENGYSVGWREEKEIPTSPESFSGDAPASTTQTEALVTKSVAEYYHEIVDLSVFAQNKTGEMIYTIEGQYTVDASNTIISCNNGSFTLNYFEAGSIFKGRAQEMSTNGYYYNGGKNAEFSASFHLMVRGSDADTSAKDYVDCGTYRGTAEAEL